MDIRDPIGIKGGMNNFRYVVGNPINIIDAEGLCHKPQGTPTPTDPNNPVEPLKPILRSDCLDDCINDKVLKLSSDLGFEEVGVITTCAIVSSVTGEVVFMECVSELTKFLYPLKVKDVLEAAKGTIECFSKCTY